MSMSELILNLEEYDKTLQQAIDIATKDFIDSGVTFSHFVSNVSWNKQGWAITFQDTDLNMMPVIIKVYHGSINLFIY